VETFVTLGVIIVVAAFLGWAAYKLLDGHIFWSQVSTAAPDKFPFTLETMLIPNNKGEKRWCRVEVYPNTIQIVGGRPASILALIRIEDVIRVTHQNRTTDGLPMAGLSLVTRQGQYMFWSEGFNAPNLMKRTAFVIRAVSGDCVQVRDLDRGRLTADNIMHIP
jgi:hypothetical protein